jgi:FixJ family two-component response regulator
LLASGRHRIRAFTSAAELLRVPFDDGEAPELLITDIVMPEMSGIELANALSARLPQLRVIILSGHAESRQLDFVDKLPSGTFLAKPFSRIDLLAAVDSALNVLPPWRELAACS